MTSSLSWKRVGAEGAVIVFSILLGLGLDAWWDDQQAVRAAREDLAGVAAELAEAEEELLLGAAQYRRMSRLTGMLVAELGTVPIDSPITLPDTLLAGVLWTVWVDDPPMALLSAFASSGQLDRMQNEELQRGLLQWVALIQDLRDDELRARNFQDREARPYVNGLADLTSARATLAAVMPFEGAPLFSADRLESLPRSPQTQVQSSVRMRSLAAEAQDFLDLLRLQSDGALLRLEALREVIARALS